ncbi:uncharacterized protein LOC144322502 isoform X2 [Canis aureus]
MLKCPSKGPSINAEGRRGAKGEHLQEHDLCEKGCCCSARGCSSHRAKPDPAAATPQQEMTSFRSPRQNHVVARARDPWLRNKYNDALWFNLSRLVSLSAVKSAACA